MAIEIELEEKTKELLEKMEKGPGFFNHNNYHIEEIASSGVTIRADLSENSMNPYGMAHGGLIFGLGDVCMGMSAAATGRKAVTLNANINYLKPGIGKYLVAKSKLVKNGKTTAYLTCDIYNESDMLVATMDSNYFYIEK